MAAKKWPGRHQRRAGKVVLAGTLPDTTATAEPQRRADPPCRIVGWRINRWLSIESVEVRRGR